MKNIFLDLRGHALRTLVAEGETVAYLKHFDKFSLDDVEHADRILSEISSDIGMKLDKIHCILPSEDTAVAVYSLPVMSRSDAEKVIQRKLVKDTNVPLPIYNILSMGALGDKQAYIVETIKRETIERYQTFFRERKIEVKTFTTALHANLKAAGKANIDPSLTTAILDIGHDIIEMTVLSHDRVLSYGKAAVHSLDIEKELQSGKTTDRIEKMRVYRVVEAVFNAQSDYKKSYPDDPVQAFLVCGTGGGLTGIHEALTESLNVSSAALDTFKTTVTDGFQFTALHGLALSVLDGTAVNYLPRESAVKLPLASLNKNALITTLSIYAIIIVALVSIVELRYRTAKRSLDAKTPSGQVGNLGPLGTDPYVVHGAYLKGLLAKQVGWNGIFGYLADNTPDGVYINSLTTNQQSGGRSLEIDFVTSSYTEVGRSKLLSKITAMIDRSGLLKRTGEPVISVTSNQAKAKLLHLKVTCEVMSVEKTN